MCERILAQNCQKFDNFNFEFSMSHHNAHYQSYKNAPVIAIPLYWCTSRIPRKSLDQPQKKICCTVVGWRAVSPVIESSLSRSRRCCSHFDQNCDGWASFVLKIRSLTSKTSLKRKKCDELLSK